MEQKELKIILSLETAKRWYKSNDTELKILALNVYTEKELTDLTLDDILYEIDEILNNNYDELLDEVSREIAEMDYYHNTNK